MKKAIRIPVVFLALFLFIPFYNIKAYEGEEKFKINTELKVSRLKLKPNTFILDYKIDDINGDNIKDSILLIGCKNGKDNSAYNEDIKLIIQDGKNNKYYKLSPGKIDFGYGGKLFLGDFNGDKILDVFASFNSGGSGGYSYYSIVSFKENNCKYLFDQEYFSKGLSFDINYADNFKINIFNKEVSKFYLVDALNKRNTYIYEGIYDKNGKMLKEQTGMEGALSELTPVDIDKDGIYELKAIQRLSGICHADTIGYAKAVWKYENSKMNLISLEILPYSKAGETKRVKTVVPVGNF